MAADLGAVYGVEAAKMLGHGSRELAVGLHRNTERIRAKQTLAMTEAIAMAIGGNLTRLGDLMKAAGMDHKSTDSMVQQAENKRIMDRARGKVQIS